MFQRTSRTRRARKAARSAEAAVVGAQSPIPTMPDTYPLDGVSSLAVVAYFLWEKIVVGGIEVRTSNTSVICLRAAPCGDRPSDSPLHLTHSSMWQPVHSLRDLLRLVDIGSIATARAHTSAHGVSLVNLVFLYLRQGVVASYSFDDI